MSMNIKKGDTVVRLSGDGGKDKDYMKILSLAPEVL